MGIMWGIFIMHKKPLYKDYQFLYNGSWVLGITYWNYCLDFILQPYIRISAFWDSTSFYFDGQVSVEFLIVKISLKDLAPKEPKGKLFWNNGLTFNQMLRYIYALPVSLGNITIRYQLIRLCGIMIVQSSCSHSLKYLKSL